MADINYPGTLPDFKLGKQRTEQQTYRVSEPFAGQPFTEFVSDDSPVIWRVTIDCVGSIQARQFQQFIKYVAGGVPFNKNILTENGHIEHEVKFLEMPLEPMQTSTNVWQYSGVIFATALINPDDDIDNPELIFEWLDQASILDIAINDSWPLA